MDGHTDTPAIAKLNSSIAEHDNNFATKSSSSSRMRVINHNWSAMKQSLHPQSVAEISLHSVLSGGRIRQCATKWYRVNSMQISGNIPSWRSCRSPALGDCFRAAASVLQLSVHVQSEKWYRHSVHTESTPPYYIPAAVAEIICILNHRTLQLGNTQYVHFIQVTPLEMCNFAELQILIPSVYITKIINSRDFWNWHFVKFNFWSCLFF